MSQATLNLEWMVNHFVESISGVSHAVVASAKGLLIKSEGSPHDRADQLAVATSEIISLTEGVSRIFGEVIQTVVETEQGFLFFMSIGEGSTLGVLANLQCDTGFVSYQMDRLTQQAATILTSDVRAELLATRLEEVASQQPDQNPT